MELVRSQKEIDQLLNELADSIEKGHRRFTGESYEEGVDAAIRWLTGMSDEYPYPAA